MKSQLAIALTVAALTACGSGSQDEAAVESSTPTTSLAPEPATSDSSPPADTTTTMSTAATTSTIASTSPSPTSNETVPSTGVVAAPVSTDNQKGPVVGLRLDDAAAIFGVAVLEEVDVDATIAAMSEALGSPTSMTEWAAMPEPLAAVGVQAFREVWWSDLRVVFERTDDTARLSSWSLGATIASGCFPPATMEPDGESMVTTDDGIGIGSDVDVLAGHYFLVNQSNAEATIVHVNPISLYFDNGQVTGIAQSRADCFADTGDQ